MKLMTLALCLTCSLTSLASTEKLSFQEPDLKMKKVITMRPMQSNLIRLYLRLPSQKRMIAGFKETRLQEFSKTSLYLDDLRKRLKSTNGKIRL